MLCQVQCGLINEMVDVPDNSDYASVAADVLLDKDPSCFLPTVVVKDWGTGKIDPFPLETVFLIWELRNMDDR